MAKRSTPHTPGPWEIAEDDIHGQAVVRGEHTEIATCWHHCVGSLEKEMRANARLIAAAPDLLATAIPALAIIEVFETAFGVTLKEGDLLRAAIDKAKGE